MLGRCFIPPGVRVSCTTTTGSVASAPAARARNDRASVVMKTGFTPCEARSRTRERQCPVFDTAAGSTRSCPSVELDVGLTQERVGHGLAGLAEGLRPGLQAIGVARHERAILGARVGIGVDLEAAVQVRLIHVNGVEARLALIGGVQEELVHRLLLGSEARGGTSCAHQGHQHRDSEAHDRHLLVCSAIVAPAILFFKGTASSEIYTLPLPGVLPSYEADARTRR